MNNNKHISLIIIIIILYVFSFIFVYFYNDKKYIILDSNYIFQINDNSIKTVKNYPSFLNNSKISYFDGYIFNKGYIKINSRKLTLAQDKKESNIDIYNNEYKKINNNNLIALYGIDEIKMKNITEDVNKKMSNNDKEIINTYLENNDIYDFNIKDFNKYKISDNEYLYSISDMSNEISSKKGSQYIFLLKNNDYKTILNNNYTSKKYILKNIFDLNNDGNYELNFSIYDIMDPYYDCETIFSNTNYNYKEVKYCNMTEGDR